MEQPLISIIIPVYNVEKLLRYSLDSITAQTWKNLEILLIDDGSVDQSSEICMEYKKRDNRIRVIRQKNKGAAAARNHGLDESRGQYVMFVDSDDTIHPRIVEILYSLISKTNTDVAVCDYKEVRDVLRNWQEESEEGKIEIYDCKRLCEVMCYLPEDVHKRILFAVPWCKLFKKKLFDGLRYPEGIICEDEFLTNRLLTRCSGLALCDKKLYAYFRHENSVMGRAYDRKRLVILDAYKERIGIVKSLGLTDCERKLSSVYIRDHIGIYCMAKARNCQDKLVYRYLKENLRKELFSYWHFLKYSERVKALIFCISPQLYITVKMKTGHGLYDSKEEIL